ncbi:alpha/beta hydrolase [Streptomyces alboniger]|uniref:Alpha/beta hydrolase n=1 Tax=Streptomyces alboniger TaxID=132473 RepID=A0A5J6HDN5_STRAD|nr:alpha/beta hydrolase [Streptomyces alboniger]QEV16384.1 alpha/beta hydrolase [Streptomyces alboniger]
MRRTRGTRRTAVLGSAGTLVAVTLIAGAVAAPTANAGTETGGTADAGARFGKEREDREARGVALAARRAAKAGVDWKDCPADWGLEKPIQCGWVTVPLDYARPDGKQIKLAVDRIGNTGTKGERQGALVYNPGGPGASGLRFPRRVVTQNKLWEKTAKAYDFVGFEPRGVGHSAPVSCMDPQEFVKAPKPDPIPDNEADKRVQRKLAAEYADGCQERSGALLPHMTTPNTARDLDVIRAALGEKKLNFLGVSYGTYLGAVYGTLFPTHVRRMVFDSVVNPRTDKIWYEVNLDQDTAFEKRLIDWMTWVAKNDAAFHLGDTYGEVRAQWEKLRATAKKRPLDGVVGPAELHSYFQNAPYYDSYWVQIATNWSKYVAGDPKPLIEAASPDMDDKAGNAASENSNAVYTAVECADAKWPRSWRKWDRDNTRIHKTSPFFTWGNAWMNLPCATWSSKQQRPLEIESRKGLPPTLLVQATRDAATPYPGALELHKHLKGSRLVTEKDAGSHGITNIPNPCLNDRVDAYLLTGRLDSSDVTCGPHATPKP